MPSRVTGHFNHHVGVNAGQLAALLDHLIRFGGHHFRADAAIDDLADAANLLLEGLPLLGDQRRIGGDSIEDSPAGPFAEFLQVGSIQEDLHTSTLQPNRTRGESGRAQPRDCPGRR